MLKWFNTMQWKRVTIAATVVAAVMTLAVLAVADEAQLEFDAAYNWALDAGFSEMFLEGIDKETMQKVYDDNVDAKDIYIVEQATPFESDSHGISEKQMSCRLTAVMHMDGNRIEKVNVYAAAQWLGGRPFLRFTDEMAVYWDDDYWVFDGNSSFLEILIPNSSKTGVPFVAESISRPGGLMNDEVSWHVSLGQRTVLGQSPLTRASFSLLPRDTEAELAKEDISLSCTYTHKMIFVQDTMSVNINIAS